MAITLAAAHSNDASRLIRIKHSKSVLENLEAVRETINIANERFEATGEHTTCLARKSINRADVRAYVYRVLDIEKEEEASTQIKNIAQSMIDLAETGRGNDLPGVREPSGASFNGIAEISGLQPGQGCCQPARFPLVR